ncbi:MFS transporter [Corynebacterium poyangense]|uniref:MFS transporter n=1 Tax=Corynebacterium poyangense TaxID=2684405 RepID=A0A7H0SL95_9CORY|nr:MFS transporter [Corynebacterium poyangense]MBZ8177410.1 MFS transporter [Corynebacterium poyangense]QNQ89320.1 MFS transporter [Corynebacterium poyangense]
MYPTLTFYLCITGTNLLDGILGSYIIMSAAASGASPAVVGLISAAAVAPWLFSLLLGTVLDHLGASRVLRIVTFIRPTAIGLIALCHWISQFPPDWSFLLWVVLALINGAVDMATDISAQTYLGQCVPPAQLVRSYGLLSSIQVVCASLLAPAVVGFLVTIPFSWVVGGAALGALLMVFPALTLNQPAPIITEPLSPQLAGAGLKALWQNNWLRRTALSVSTLNIMNSAAGAVGMVYLLQELHIKPEHLGIVWSLVGVASAAGGYLAGKLSTALGFSAAVFLGATALVLSDAALLLSASLSFLAATWILTGFFTPLFAVNLMSQRQRSVPLMVLGRVNAAFQFLGIGSAPIGSLLGGFCASAWGVWPVLLAVFLINAVTLLINKPWSR